MRVSRSAPETLRPCPGVNVSELVSALISWLSSGRTTRARLLYDTTATRLTTPPRRSSATSRATNDVSLLQSVLPSDLDESRTSVRSRRLQSTQPIGIKTLNAVSGCRLADLERPAGRRDVCRVVIQLPSVTQNLTVHQILTLSFPWTGLLLTCLYSMDSLIN